MAPHIWLKDDDENSGAVLHEVAAWLYPTLMRGGRRRVSGCSSDTAENICARLDTMQRVLDDEPGEQRGFRAVQYVKDAYTFWRATSEDTYIDNL